MFLVSKSLNLRCLKPWLSWVLSFSSSQNMSEPCGTCGTATRNIYMTLTTLFISQCMGVDLSWGDKIKATGVVAPFMGVESVETVETSIIHGQIPKSTIPASYANYRIAYQTMAIIKLLLYIRLVVWNSFYFSIICWECHHPNWRTHIFQRGRYTTNQISSICFIVKTS